MNAERRYWMCIRKKRYDTLKEAESAAKGASKTYGKPMRAYPYPVCRGHHITAKVRDQP